MTNVARHRILATLLMVSLLSSCKGPEPGPLEPQVPLADQGGGFAEDADHTFTFSQVYLRNYGDVEAVIDSVSLVDPDPGVQLIQALAAARQHQPHRYGGDDAFPPPYPFSLEPAEGFVLAPTIETDVSGSGALIVLGIRSAGEGIHGFRSVAIDYHVGDSTYRYVFRYAVAVCAPQAYYLAHPEECNAEELMG